MNKSKTDIIIDILTFVIVFEIRYLCRLEYQLGCKNASNTPLSKNLPVETIEDRARQIAAELQNTDEIF